MVTVIEKGRAVYVIQDEQFSDADYLLLVKEVPAGHNDADGEACKWTALGFSWEYSLWPTIGERAGLCEVGRIRVNGDADLFNRSGVETMEGYVALYRDAISKAVDGKKLFERFSVTACIKIPGEGVAGVKDDCERDGLVKFLSEHLGVGTVPESEAIVPIDSLSAFKAAYSLSLRFPGADNRNPFVRFELKLKERVCEKVCV